MDDILNRRMKEWVTSGKKLIYEMLDMYTRILNIVLKNQKSVYFKNKIQKLDILCQLSKEKDTLE